MIAVIRRLDAAPLALRKKSGGAEFRTRRRSAADMPAPGTKATSTCCRQRGLRLPRCARRGSGRA